jgi:hypothetical protein
VITRPDRWPCAAGTGDARISSIAQPVLPCMATAPGHVLQ